MSFPIKVVIFRSYVKLPEGTWNLPGFLPHLHTEWAPPERVQLPQTRSLMIVYGRYKDITLTINNYSDNVGPWAPQL